MPPKRKSDAADLDEYKSDASSSVKENDASYEPITKKARTSGASEKKVPSAKGKAKESKEPVRWQDVKIEDEDEDVGFLFLISVWVLSTYTHTGNRSSLVRRVLW